MGTNFYLQGRKPCEHCGRPYKDLHIGKSSIGWVFMLRSYPEEGINNLNDWVSRFAEKDAVIHDEYGNEIDKFDMLRRIVCRHHPAGLKVDSEGVMKSTHYVVYTTSEREFS